MYNQGIVRGKPFKQKDSLRQKVKKLIQTYDQTSRTTYKLELRYYLGEILNEYNVKGIKSHQRVEDPPSNHVIADLISEDRLMLEDNATSITTNAQEGEDNQLQNQISLKKPDASWLLLDIPEES